MRLYGAAKASQERRLAREAKRESKLNVKRSALSKMQRVYRLHKETTSAEWNTYKLNAHIGTAKAIFKIALYALPTLAMVAALLRFILWIL